jgi:hypothetical protein
MNGVDKMKQLISATLSQEAAMIYNNWEKQKKSSILSELIVKENGSHKQVIVLQKKKDEYMLLVSQAMIALHLKDPEHPLLRDLNESLKFTIHYQYWD